MSALVISGMTGNEIFCLAQKGLLPGELCVGNSVCSMGLGGAVGSFGQALAGGEIRQITELISEGRHAAITRMEQEAQRFGAAGVTSVVTELRTLAGYTEFLSQGTAVHAQPDHVLALGAARRDAPGGPAMPFFSTAASGMQTYCHLDAGYRPMKFVMGNIAYALGVGRGISGGFRKFARGEVHEYSQMYNEIRHVALQRIREEASHAGANAVVDIQIRMLPYGPGAIELLMTGTASHHANVSPGHVAPQQVVTSELTGEELWNLAKLGLVPVSLVMSTSVFSLGIAGGIGAWFKSFSKGELPEVTSLVYHARENCLDLLRKEAQALGAERVVGNKLIIQELSPGLIEVVAIGTALRRATGFEPQAPALMPQAIIVDKDVLESEGPLRQLPAQQPLMTGGGARRQMSPVGCIVLAVWMMLVMIAIVGGIVASLTGGHHHR
ncbi:MAG TPA: heavy metal-binding domain-containing protein [Minicystis sp.]|nr:heavy metal-binding domain-containing protein [Minicystis sp.]